MAVEKIYPHLCCTDLARSAAWYAALLGRPADQRPMDGLEEWHHREAAGLQLSQDPARAGGADVTLIVSDLDGEHLRAREAGLAPGAVAAGDFARFFQLRDPDGNRVVLAQPAR